jgi:hypothetical protein
MRSPEPFLNAPTRYLPHFDLPAYRHVPRMTPHPRTAADGHSVDTSEPVCEPLTNLNWSQHVTWLFGVDLFNQAYWWEAHEQWEAAWKQAEGDTAHLLQGMIQLGAALIKWNLGNDRGREGLWSRSHQHLHQIVAPQWCGVCIRPLAEEAGRFFNHHPRAPLRGWLEGPVLQLETLSTR